MSFTRFHKEISNFISNNTEIINIIGNITKIANEYFYIKCYDISDECEIKCYYKNIFNFKIGDNVYLEGYPNFSSKLKIIVNVDLLYSLSDEQIYDDMKMCHSKLEKQLSKKDATVFIKDLLNQRPLSFIKNIGLIVFDKDNENFIQMFNNSCVGNLYIHTVKLNNVKTNFLLALTYFKDYKEVDTIVILLDNLNAIELMELSSKSIINYFLQINLPYIILKHEPNKNIIVPSLLRLCNEIYMSDREIIERIAISQNKIKNKLSESIILASKHLGKQIDKYTIFLHNKKIENMYLAKNSIEILKKLLSSQLNNYKITLLEKLLKLKN